ncbi:DUF1553 domain-containing protein [Akkermansiaceae bacterium]|nr:DUF1553 domain-containing protein [Akkermansiaceae bacterium]
MPRFLNILFPVALIMPYPAVAEAEILFNRDVRPIFLKHCTACHGGVKEAGGISMIFRERLLIEGESGKIAVVPGKPEESEMIRRVRHTDPDEIMPKPKHGPPLVEAEIAVLEKWISQGAKWEEHWAFMPPAETEVRDLKNEAWVSQPLDRFVLKGIENAGLSPSPEAGAPEWLRRVSFDLTGLPPAVDDVKALEAAWETDGDKAREEAVDKLLASPAYGERWAAVWLDLARYADTFGFEKDPHRDIWPWRDWVIRSLNADMPYDQFTIEQLAGDLLPDPTPDQILATAFQRNSQTNTEGGTDDEEFRVAAVIDRMSTTWTTWQATTFGCVQCHSHPYDPIAHDEFYEFMDFYNQSEDSDLNYEFPKLKLAGADFLKLEKETRMLREELDAEGRGISDVAWANLRDIQLTPQFGTLEADESGLITSEGTLRRGVTHKVSGMTGDFDAMKISIFPESDDPKDWPQIGVMVTDFLMEKVSADGKRTAIPMAEVIADYLVGPSDPMSAFAQQPGGEKFKRFIGPGGAGGGGAGFGEYPRLTGPRWFVLLPETRVGMGEGERIEVSLKQGANANESQGTYLRKFRIEVAEDDRYATLRSNAERAEKWQRVMSNRDRLAAMKGTEVPVMRDRSTHGKRDTRVFARGNRMTKEHPVKADVPDLLKQGYEGGKDGNRLDLARWLVSGENPLTSRVMVNRLWGEVFGIGIVESAEDFGTSGTAPSNLALLDHLALRFQGEHGWSMKKALREIVLSSAYRQTSKATPELIEKDPKNQLVARGPRNRLTAEMVRDQALAVSGLLAPKMFGPSVFPPQPAGVWSSVYSGAKWNESKGEDRYRRSVYTYQKRTSGFPGFLTFDAPSRDVCTARRIVSNTPLQALVTMNDPAHIEAAAALADRMRQRGGSTSDQLGWAYFAATQIHADAETVAELTSLYEDLKREDHTTSAKLGADPALTLTANTILNLDAALSK